jgi:hypothetical protein
LEDPLEKMIEGLVPVLEVVRMFIHVPDVRDVFLLQLGVDSLADANQAVLIAARDKEEF